MEISEYCDKLRKEYKELDDKLYNIEESKKIEEVEPMYDRLDTTITSFLNHTDDEGFTKNPMWQRFMESKMWFYRYKESKGLNGHYVGQAIGRLKESIGWFELLEGIAAGV
jgi:hypothetical protein